MGGPAGQEIISIPIQVRKLEGPFVMQNVTWDILQLKKFCCKGGAGKRELMESSLVLQEHFTARPFSHGNKNGMVEEAMEKGNSPKTPHKVIMEGPEEYGGFVLNPKVAASGPTRINLPFPSFFAAASTGTIPIHVPWVDSQG